MPPSATRSLAGLRILVAEDHLLLSHFIQEVLLARDCTVVGPAHDVAGALDAIRTQEIDGALLDVSLGADSIYPAAKELAARSIPFILMTGHTNLDAFPALLGTAPCLVKPFRIQQLEDMLEDVFRMRMPPGPNRS